MPTNIGTNDHLCGVQHCHKQIGEKGWSVEVRHVIMKVIRKEEVEEDAIGVEENLGIGEKKGGGSIMVRGHIFGC